MLGDIGERESRESGDIKQRSPHLPIKTVCLHFKNQNISVYLFYLCICVGLPNCLMYFDWSISSFPFAGVYDSCVWCFSCWFLKLRSFIMWGCRCWGWQAAGTWVSISVKWWDSPPPSGDLEPANQYAPSKKPARELKSPRVPKWTKARAVCTNRIALSLNQSPRSLYQ